MDMTTYLAEIEHAATAVIALIWREREKLKELEKSIAVHTDAMKAGYGKVASLVADPDLDDDLLATAVHWDTYWGPDKDQHEATEEKAAVTSSILARAFSTSVLSASALQYGKQGISLVHGGLQHCPAGRSIGSQAVRDIVWQGRNHALHWEEGNPHKPVEDCFNALTVDFGIQFADFKTRNLAFEVIELLGWRTFAEFKADMLTLA